MDFDFSVAPVVYVRVKISSPDSYENVYHYYTFCIQSIAQLTAPLLDVYGCCFFFIVLVSCVFCFVLSLFTRLIIGLRYMYILLCGFFVRSLSLPVFICVDKPTSMK